MDCHSYSPTVYNHAPPCVSVSYSTLIPENFMHFCLVRVLACVSHKIGNFFGHVKFSGVLRNARLVIVSTRETFCDLYTKIHSSQSYSVLDNIWMRRTLRSLSVVWTGRVTSEGKKGNQTLCNCDLDLISCISVRFSYFTAWKSRSTFFAIGTWKLVRSHCNVSSGARFWREK